LIKRTKFDKLSQHALLLKFEAGHLFSSYIKIHMAQKETPWFYHPNFSEKDLLPDEARHAGSALRLQEGAEVRLTNGQGQLATAIVQEVKKGRVSVKILSIENYPLASAPKTLLIGRMHHADRLEWLVEKVQELGIKRILVADMDNCGPGKLNLERLQRIAISALKQSHQPYLCEIEAVKSLDAALATCMGAGIFGYISETTQPEPITMHATAAFAVIGPEADFSTQEVDFMLEKGLKPVSLGSTRLRTETAALAAAVFLQLSA
jgi:16S rRNA (uracil1498-N3)-methyltransferase